MEFPSITLARTSQFLSLWQPTKQVGIRFFALYGFNVHGEKAKGDNHEWYWHSAVEVELTVNVEAVL
jgi:hypothetical protein